MTNEVSPAAPQTDKKVFIETFGCQMNILDSELVRDKLAPLGYEFVPTDKNSITGTTNYSSKQVCAVQKENIFGTQFHPEKSDKLGLKIINNFIDL